MNNEQSRQRDGISAERHFSNNVVDFADEDERIEVLPIINLLLRNRGLILRPAIYLTLAVGLVTLMLTPTYTATAKFISSGGSSSSSPAVMGPSGAQRIGQSADLTMIDGMPEYYQSLLQSDDFLRAALKHQYTKVAKKPSEWVANELGADDPDLNAINSVLPRLKGAISIENAKASSPRATILVLKVDGKDAELTTQLANDLLDELSAYGGDARMQKSIKDRDFIQKQLDETETQLRADEAALANFSMRNRKIVTPDLENERARLQRSVSVQEEIFLTLKKELEASKIKVQENLSVLQILEKPTSIQTGPKRGRYLIMAFFIGVFIFGGRVIFRDWWHRLDESNSDAHELVTNLVEIRDEVVEFCRTVLVRLGGAVHAVLSRAGAVGRRLISKKV